MKRLLLLALLAAPAFSAQAQVVINGTITNTYTLKARPTFFFKPNPEGTQIAYNVFTRGREDHEGNFIVDLKTNKVTNVPGTYDPVFAHSNQILVSIDRAVYLNFYDLRSIRKDGSGAVAIYSDTEMSGFYQSVGVLKSSATEVDYRILLESAAGHLSRDYRVNLKTMKVTPLTEVRSVCSEFGLKLPMISKNGQELGAQITSSNTMAIFHINDDMSCTLVKDLKLTSGKLAFSYDGRYVAYHRFDDYHRLLHDDYVERPPANAIGDIFVYDRVADKTWEITRNTDSNSFYPEFLPNGDLMFIDYDHDPAVKARLLRVRLPASVPAP